VLEEHPKEACEIAASAKGRLRRLIAVYDGSEWNTISFPLAVNHSWTHVYPSSPYENQELMYAISSYYCGDPGAIYIYRSADRGRSWIHSRANGGHLRRIHIGSRTPVGGLRMSAI
jgi:hypothetical protein